MKKGFKHSEEHKKKISESCRGKRLSKEHKRNISDAIRKKNEANGLGLFYNKRKCFCCKKEKPLSAFAKDRKSKQYGVQARCKECNALLRKRDLEKNPYYFWAYASLNNHKHKGYIINITIKELISLAKKSEYCPLCGIKFLFNYGRKKIVRNSPSLDRINNGKIMNKDNVQIICHLCNVTKGPRTMKEFTEYCKRVASLPL